MHSLRTADYIAALVGFVTFLITPAWWVLVLSTVAICMSRSRRARLIVVEGRPDRDLYDRSIVLRRTSAGGPTARCSVRWTSSPAPSIPASVTLDMLTSPV